MDDKDLVAGRRVTSGGYGTRDMQSDRNYAAPNVTEKAKDAVSKDRSPDSNVRDAGAGKGKPADRP